MATITSVWPNVRSVYSAEHGVSIMCSYTTPVAAHFDETNRTVVVDESYSPTTSRHIRRWLENRPTPEKVSQGYLDELMENALGYTRLAPS